jgi:transcription elongation factor Elf1
MQNIITWLLVLIQYQNEVIKYLSIMLFGKNYHPKSEKCTDKKYTMLSVDHMPVFEKPAITKIYDSTALIAERSIKPVKNRGGKVVPADTVCPYCGASHEYLYDNNGGKGQFLCKVCGSTFFPQVPAKQDHAYCPFCSQKLSLIKKRKTFDVYRCGNPHCSYRRKKLSVINDVLVKLTEIPQNLNLITDGNPIYLLAQQWFAQHGIYFDITQVIGLTNDDDVSKEFRPLKQIIERLNRTFKGNYKPTGGFGAEFGAISSVVLFVAYFNFLRPHSKLDNNVPVLIPELNTLPNMPAKWLMLIKMSEDYIKSQT